MEDALLLHIQRQLGLSASAHFAEYGWVFAKAPKRGDELAQESYEIYRLYTHKQAYGFALDTYSRPEIKQRDFERCLQEIASASEIDTLDLLASLQRVERHSNFTLAHSS